MTDFENNLARLKREESVLWAEYSAELEKLAPLRNRWSTLVGAIRELEYRKEIEQKIRAEIEQEKKPTP